VKPRYCRSAVWTIASSNRMRALAGCTGQAGPVYQFISENRTIREYSIADVAKLAVEVAPVGHVQRLAAIDPNFVGARQRRPAEG
jgi:hypothetical protein